MQPLDYEPVGMVTAAPGGARWYHQHFSVSARSVPIDGLVRPAQPGPRSRRAGREASPTTRRIDINEGGNAIPYWMEDPYIRKEYEAKLKEADVNNRMDPAWYLPPERK